MEKKGIGKIITIIILLVIVLGLGGYLGYHTLVEDKENTNKINELNLQIKKLKNQNNSLTNNNSETYTYKDLAGVYKYSKKIDNQTEETFKLQLDENGMFLYDKESLAGAGYIGNYVIKNDEIHLNALFYHGSSALLEVKMEQNILKIDSKEKIIDQNLDKFDTGQTKKYDEVVLQKDSKEEKTPILTMYDLNEYGIANAQHPAP